ncbi:RICIN domain-containing protein [Streptomyces sp. NPDC056061]|uniref:RICIN domain-containing protein n=1 Tax=Streptomyces sp. NPDC056061 TaxID=3345700 RepID=UPI0035DB6FB9
MPKRHHPGRVLAAAVLAVAGLAAAGQAPASAAPTPNQDLINKMDGSRLALLNNSTAEGATGITLRDPAWKYSTERWEIDLSAWQADAPNTYTATLRNEAANKCLQPSAATPQRGTAVVVRTCDGSRLQKWSLYPEKAGDTYTGWWMYRPMVNKDLALSLNRYNDGSWDTLYLNIAQPSSDRLWRRTGNDSPVANG